MDLCQSLPTMAGRLLVVIHNHTALRIPWVNGDRCYKLLLPVPASSRDQASHLRRTWRCIAGYLNVLSGPPATISSVNSPMTLNHTGQQRTDSRYEEVKTETWARKNNLTLN